MAASRVLPRLVQQLVAPAQADWAATPAILRQLSSIASQQSAAVPCLQPAALRAGFANPATPAVAETRQAWQPPGLDGQLPAAARAAAAGDDVSSAAPPFPEMDEVFQTLQEMGLQPGRNCVVGDGLAVVDIGLYVQVEEQQQEQPGGGSQAAGSRKGLQVALEMQEHKPHRTMTTDAREYALKRARRSVLQRHGWHAVTLVAESWRKLTAFKRPLYLVHTINTSLNGHDHSHGGGGCGHDHGHEHGAGCGHDHHQLQSPDDYDEALARQESQGGGGGGCCAHGSHSHDHSSHSHDHQSHDHSHKAEPGGGGCCKH